jgi:hypothetical protein
VSADSFQNVVQLVVGVGTGTVFDCKRFVYICEFTSLSLVNSSSIPLTLQRKGHFDRITNAI